MKKFFLFMQALFMGFIAFLGLAKNNNPAYGAMTSNYALDEYSDYIGIVRKISEMESAPVDQFSYSLTNTTGKNLNIALSIPGMIDVLRTVVPDASGNVTANGGGVIAVTGTAPITLKDRVTDIASVKTVDAVIGDGIPETGGAKVLYANTVNPSTARLTIAPDNLPVSFFLNQMNSDKFIVDSIDITVNDNTVYSNGSITIKDANAFNSQAEKVIKLRDFEPLDSLKDKKINVDTVKKYGYIIQLDRKSLLTLYMPGLVNGVANTFITIQFNVKKVVDDAQESINVAVKEYTSLSKTGKPTTKFQEVIKTQALNQPTNKAAIEKLVSEKFTELTKTAK